MHTEKLCIHFTLLSVGGQIELLQGLKVRGHRSNFLDSLSQPFEIGPSDLRMTPNAFGAIKLLMATCTDQDTQKKVGLWVVSFPSTRNLMKYARLTIKKETLNRV